MSVKKQSKRKDKSPNPAKSWHKTLHWVTAVAIALFVGLGLFAASINPIYPRFEYGREGFIEDYYGWTNEQRLELALVAVDYLRRPEPAEEAIYLLEEQTKPGTNEPLYNEREIGHMLDVKIVADNVVRRLARIGGALSLLGVALLWQQKRRKLAMQSIMRGGMILTLLLAGIGLFIGVAWDRFFTLFHELLFPPDTWMFPLDDSLIRLFTYQFWQDYGILVSGSILLAGVLVWAAGYWLQRRV